MQAKVKIRSQNEKVKDVHANLSMTQSQLLTWARTGKGPVNAVVFRIGGKSSICECGHKKQTTVHFLLNCPLYGDRPTLYNGAKRRNFLLSCKSKTTAQEFQSSWRDPIDSIIERKSI
ncbi:hypothetical protein MP228_013070 [Amoeboaphelidium protococcarum]|nr:hypothetical protein MP228_013070 [Amoeboaphelidium protococcarum]